ncbi:hypothetical protein NEHOM01_1849 [Nematocida homosporus]|uniref:uncharacterized protein n=1 Tax=Nematocida homosporus TaxID=1912981 RepID=UPI00221EF5CC|nr:uncharacterized protein NEHOM01_1849 [Nematocida homosporus]KAI5186991.1 hypothetical protein NEHOM01_1849 [Nematocida homosporus]
MQEVYREHMPLTALLNIQGNVLVGGGGGNVQFGFPNQIVLVSPSKAVLAKQDVRTVVISLNGSADAVIVSYGDSFDLFEIDKDLSTLIGPFPLPNGCISAVICGSTLYYLLSRRLYSLPISGFIKGASPGLMALPATMRTTDTVIRLFSGDSGVDCLVQREGDYLLINNQSVSALEDKISYYTREGESLAYIIQRSEERTGITMQYQNKVYQVIESRCICVCALGQGLFVVGDGDGSLIAYRRGREVWRKKVSHSPITSISRVERGGLMCCTIHGDLISTGVGGGMRGWGLGVAVVGLGVLGGVGAKYWAMGVLSRGLEIVRSWFG